MNVNLNSPQIKPGHLTQADFDREPGPQHSKASPLAHLAADIFLTVGALAASMYFLVDALRVGGLVS